MKSLPPLVLSALSLTSTVSALPISLSPRDDTDTHIPIHTVSEERVPALNVICEHWHIVNSTQSATAQVQCGHWIPGPNAGLNNAPQEYILKTVKLEEGLCSVWHVESHDNVVQPVCGRYEYETSRKPGHEHQYPQEGAQYEPSDLSKRGKVDPYKNPLLRQVLHKMAWLRKLGLTPNRDGTWSWKKHSTKAANTAGPQMSKRETSDPHDCIPNPGRPYTRWGQKSDVCGIWREKPSERQMEWIEAHPECVGPDWASKSECVNGVYDPANSELSKREIQAVEKEKGLRKWSTDKEKRGAGATFLLGQITKWLKNKHKQNVDTRKEMMKDLYVKFEAINPFSDSTNACGGDRTSCIKKRDVGAGGTDVSSAHDFDHSVGHRVASRDTPAVYCYGEDPNGCEIWFSKRNPFHPSVKLESEMLDRRSDGTSPKETTGNEHSDVDVNDHLSHEHWYHPDHGFICGTGMVDPSVWDILRKNITDAINGTKYASHSDNAGVVLRRPIRLHGHYPGSMESHPRWPNQTAANDNQLTRRSDDNDESDHLPFGWKPEDYPFAPIIKPYDPEKHFHWWRRDVADNDALHARDSEDSSSHSIPRGYGPDGWEPINNPYGGPLLHPAPGMKLVTRDEDVANQENELKDLSSHRQNPGCTRDGWCLLGRGVVSSTPGGEVSSEPSPKAKAINELLDPLPVLPLDVGRTYESVYGAKPDSPKDHIAQPDVDYAAQQHWPPFNSRRSDDADAITRHRIAAELAEPLYADLPNGDLLTTDTGRLRHPLDGENWYSDLGLPPPTDSTHLKDQLPPPDDPFWNQMESLPVVAPQNTIASSPMDTNSVFDADKPHPRHGAIPNPIIAKREPYDPQYRHGRGKAYQDEHEREFLLLSPRNRA